MQYNYCFVDLLGSVLVCNITVPILIGSMISRFARSICEKVVLFDFAACTVFSFVRGKRRMRCGKMIQITSSVLDALEPWPLFCSVDVFAHWKTKCTSAHPTCTGNREKKNKNRIDWSGECSMIIITTWRWLMWMLKSWRDSWIIIIAKNKWHRRRVRLLFRRHYFDLVLFSYAICSDARSTANSGPKRTIKWPLISFDYLFFLGKSESLGLLMKCH